MYLEEEAEGDVGVGGVGGHGVPVVHDRDRLYQHGAAQSGLEAKMVLIYCSFIFYLLSIKYQIYKMT